VLKTLFSILSPRSIRERLPAGKKSRAAARNRTYFGGWQVHERMLADVVRVETYSEAIKKYVRRDSTVADLGSGTGVLSFLALNAGAGKVFAIEHGDIIHVGELLAKHNGYSSIQFFKQHSKSVKLPESVDFIVHEQMGSLIDEERMIENVLDLRDRALKPGGRILPNAFSLYLEPVQLMDEGRVPFLWQQSMDEIDFSILSDMRPKEPSNYFQRRIAPSVIDFMMTAPEPFWEFDLETLTPNQIPNNFSLQKRVSRGGRLDGFCFFFRAAFDDDIYIDTLPTSSRRPVNWSNLLLYRGDGQTVSEGDVLSLDLTIPDFSSPREWLLRWRKQSGEGKR
jgi:type I protein arginine methyltransferase